MTPETFEKVIGILKSHGYDLRSYSGRGMYGKECLAVTVDSPDEVYTLGDLLSGHDVGKPRTDSMGMSYVVYWENIPYNEEDED